MPKVNAIPSSGRPRKPTAIKKLAGTLKSERTNHSEPAGRAIAIPPPPRHLSDLERAAWRRLARVVDPMRIATEADLEAFELLVSEVALVDAARASLRACDGEILVAEETAHGTSLKPRPEIGIIERHNKLVMYHFSRWGLTPADRSRVSTLGDGRPSTDPLAEFSAPPGEVQ